jgi:hypothetical protein
MDNLTKTTDEMAMRYAQSTGFLQGILISMALYEDITPSKFKHIYEALNRSNELAGKTMMDFDRERLHKRAGELGVTI